MAKIQRFDTMQWGFDVIFNKPPSPYEKQLLDALAKAKAEVVVFDTTEKIRARYTIAHLPTHEAVSVHIRSLLVHITTSRVFEWQIWPVWQVLVHLDKTCNPQEKQRATALLTSYAVNLSWGEDNRSFTLMMHTYPDNQFMNMIRRALDS
jgi:hypothetical protein